MRAAPSVVAPSAEANTEAPVYNPLSAENLPISRHRAIALKVSVIARQLRQRFDQVVEGDGLTRGKWSVVVAVARNLGATQRTIAGALEITEVTAGQMIDRLCADGYLERREHPKDRRAYCVHLTPAAQPLLARLEEIAKMHEEQTFAGLTDDDLLHLDAMLNVVARNLAASRTRDGEAKLAGTRGQGMANRASAQRRAELEPSVAHSADET